MPAATPNCLTRSSIRSCPYPLRISANRMRSLTLLCINGASGTNKLKAVRTDSQNTCSEDSKYCHRCACFVSRHWPVSHLYFKPLLSEISMAVRGVKGVHLGRLITVRGIVTRVSEVKPLLLVNAYTCDVCGSETFQEISRKEFNPVADCQNENECVRNNIKGSLHMQTRACRFSPFQEVKIQEMVFASDIS